MSKLQGSLFNYENVHMSMSLFMLFTCVRAYTNTHIRLSATSEYGDAELYFEIFVLRTEVISFVLQVPLS